MQRRIYQEAHQAVQELAREFLHREVIPQLPQFQKQHGFSREFWRAAGATGLLGLRIPAEYGGAGATDPLLSIALSEELARVSPAISSCVGVHAAICAHYLVAHGSDQQRESWLPKIASGELLCALAMTEPGGGSDLAALRTTATVAGDDWLLNGSKIFITNGGSADLILVAASTDPALGARGITLFGVLAESAGFRRGRILDKVGQDEADTAELFFDNVRVPDSQRLGEVNTGFAMLMQHLVAERMGAAVANTAHADQILKETLDYVKKREAFGQPIGSFQHNKFRLAEMFTRISVTQAFVDRCLEEYAVGELSAVDAAKAKWWSAEVQNDVIDDCVQLHGGYGYMNEYRVARAWRDARVTKIWAGSKESMKEIIGRDLGL